MLGRLCTEERANRSSLGSANLNPGRCSLELSTRTLLSILVAMDVAFLLAWAVTVSRSPSDRLLSVTNRPGVSWRALGSVFREWQQSIEFNARHPHRLAGALLICLPIHATWFLIVYLLAGEIGIELSLLHLTMVAAFSWVIVAVPVPLGGVGVRDLSFAYLLSLQGSDSDRPVVLGACQAAIFLAPAFFGAPIFWLGRKGLAEATAGRVS